MTGELAGVLSRTGFVTCTVEEIAVLRTTAGPEHLQITDEVLARAPRTAVTSVQLHRGHLLSRLTVAFAGGASWEFEVPAAYARSAERLAATLRVGLRA
jgi:hypothetical protein